MFSLAFFIPMSITRILLRTFVRSYFRMAFALSDEDLAEGAGRIRDFVNAG